MLMKYLSVIFSVIIFSRAFALGEQPSPVDFQAAGCGVWGDVIAPSSVIEGELQMELTGSKSMPSQRARVVNGSFEFPATSPGVYQFRLLTGSGSLILKETRQLKGNNDRIMIHLPSSLSTPAAIVSVHELSRKIPQKALDAFHAGERAVDAGDWDGAIARFEKALSLAPQFAEAEVNLAVQLVRLGRMEDAVTHAQRAFHDDPDLDVSGYDLSIMLISVGRYAEGEPVLRDLLRTREKELRPDQIAELNGLLAVSLAGQGKIEDAFQHMRLASTDFPALRLLFANALAWSRHLNLAVMQVREYLEFNTSTCEHNELEAWITSVTASPVDTASTR
jgi:tetratricopeptide (TPR) repeat protein